MLMSHPSGSHDLITGSLGFFQRTVTFSRVRGRTQERFSSYGGGAERLGFALSQRQKNKEERRDNQRTSCLDLRALIAALSRPPAISPVVHTDTPVSHTGVNTHVQVLTCAVFDRSARRLVPPFHFRLPVGPCVTCLILGSADSNICSRSGLKTLSGKFGRLRGRMKDFLQWD